MTKIKFQSPVLFVEDIDRAKDFYTRVLKGSIEHDFGKNITFFGGLSIWELNDKHVIKQNLNTTDPSNRFEMYFETEDINQTFDSLKKAQVVFLHELHTEAWGQITCRFFDPDHHLIEVGESMPTFIKRIYGETGSLEKTTEITGVPTDTIQKIIS